MMGGLTVDKVFFLSLIASTVYYTHLALDEGKMEIRIEHWPALTLKEKEAYLPVVLKARESKEYHELLFVNNFLHGVYASDKTGRLQKIINDTIPDSAAWYEETGKRLKVRSSYDLFPGSTGITELRMAYYGSADKDYLAVMCHHAQIHGDSLLKDYVLLWHLQQSYIYPNQKILPCVLPGHEFHNFLGAEFTKYLLASDYWKGTAPSVEDVMKTL
jgi:hypothetical protein